MWGKEEWGRGFASWPCSLFAWGAGRGGCRWIRAWVLTVGQIPEYVTMLHPRSTQMHTRALSHTSTLTDRLALGSRQPCTQCSGLQQLRLPAAPPPWVQRGSGRGWSHSRGDNSTKKEGKWCKHRPLPHSAPDSPFLAPGCRGQGQLTHWERGREPRKGGAHWRGARKTKGREAGLLGEQAYP